ncbi:MAG: hypothetical protein KatS3mg108_3145 [Isosphaeraceae bacterium]|jgi:hypothetical protein|nr:MAG: hypothetical protein KatS3mg108_3145 [Isosphaeraceae bacterium]
MCTDVVTSIDLDSPDEKYSVYVEGQKEADRYKWYRSEEVGYDLGEQAIREWVRHYWNRFLRHKWVEHLYGRKFWIELDQVDFGILRRKFQDSKLLRPILDRLLNGEENLNIIWSINDDRERAEVMEILEVVHVNSTRLEFQLENRLAERRHLSRMAARENRDLPWQPIETTS